MRAIGCRAFQSAFMLIYHDLLDTIVRASSTSAILSPPRLFFFPFPTLALECLFLSEGDVPEEMQVYLLFSAMPCTAADSDVSH